jgi:hypothetical protein
MLALHISNQLVLGNGIRVVNASDVIRAQLICEANVLSHSYQKPIKTFLKIKMRYGIDRENSKQFRPRVADFTRVVEDDIYEIQRPNSIFRINGCALLHERREHMQFVFLALLIAFALASQLIRQLCSRFRRTLGSEGSKTGC